MRAAGDNENFFNAGLNQSVNGVINHRLVVDRKKMLIGRMSKGVESGTKPTSKNNAFHGGYYTRVGLGDARREFLSVFVGNRRSAKGSGLGFGSIAVAVDHADDFFDHFPGGAVTTNIDVDFKLIFFLAAIDLLF